MLRRRLDVRAWMARRVLNTLAVAQQRAKSLSTRDELHSDQQRQHSVHESAVPNVRFRKFLVGLKHFHDRMGHFLVPRQFKIPRANEQQEMTLEQRQELTFWPVETHGLPLGSQLHGYTTAVRKSLLTHPQWEPFLKEWQAIGFPVESWEEYNHNRNHGFPQRKWDDYVWEISTLPAFKTYKRLHGDLLVAPSFVVPTNDSQWPRETWELPLGALAYRIYQKRHELSEIQTHALTSLGFPCHVDAIEWKYQWLPALTQYKAMHGDLLVPRGYVTGKNDARSWPEELQGLKLGKLVHQLRGKRAGTSIDGALDQLNALGFDWDPSLTCRWRHKIYPALQVYRRLHGDCLVPMRFKVPQSSRWPLHLWGMHLGSIVNGIRAHKSYLQVHGALQDLRAVDFDWDPMQTRWRQSIVPALQMFRHIHGHAAVPSSFVVPKCAPWPDHVWDLNLGHVVNNIRARQDFMEVDGARDDLQAVGFDWDPIETRWRDTIYPALQIYHALYGHSAVPQRFTVPKSGPWPTHLWGCKLGKAVNKIRSRKDFLEVDGALDDLQAIHFDWHPVETRWHHTILPALELYHQLHGHCEVPRKFEVPPTNLWPQHLWGLKLGGVATRIRHRGDFKEQIARDHERWHKLAFRMGSDEQIARSA